jgi:hypothetical protein
MRCMLYARRWLFSSLLSVGILASACHSGDGTSGPSPEIVPAGDVVADVQHPLAARYWVELSPQGSLHLYPIYPGNVIYRGLLESAVNYDYSGTATQDQTTTCATPPCLPAVNSAVTLHTDQSQVTYVDGANNCYSNGQFFAADPSCGGKLALGDVCRRQHTFCGPITLVSSMNFGQTVGAMPNPVLQVVDPMNGAQANSVLGCNDQDPAGDATGEHGLCAFTNASKVDDPTTSNLSSPIPGDGVNNFGCSFCYGNQFQAISRGMPGLTDTVLSDPPPAGVDQTLAAVNTDRIVIELQNDDNLDLVFTVRYAAPALDVGGLGAQLFYEDTAVTPSCTAPPCPASCLTRGKTRMTVSGASFGPPAECLTGAQPITSCPAEGTTPAGSSLSVPGFATAQTPQLWSDTRVEFTPPADTMAECGLSLSTPVGTTATSDPVEICGDQFRSWTPTLGGATVARIGAAAGVLTSGATKLIVLTGGRTSIGDFTAVTSSTLALPLPTCANQRPNWTTVSVSGTPPARWGMAYTVAANKLFVLGGAATGTISAGSCTRAAKMFRLTSATSGVWTNLPNIPDMDINNGNQGLCDATMTTVKSPSGKEWVVVTGGSVVPVPNNLCTGGDVPTLASGRTTLVLDPSATVPTWQLFAGTTGTDLQRFGAVGAANLAGSAALVTGGSTSTSAPGSTTRRTTRLTISNTGVPTFADVTTASGPPSGQFLGAAASGDNVIYVSGGATAVAVTGSCTASTRANLPALNRLMAVGGDFVAPWTTLVTMPATRLEHVMVAAESTGGTEDKLYVIGGHDGSGAVATTVLEYTP